MVTTLTTPTPASTNPPFPSTLACGPACFPAPPQWDERGCPSFHFSPRAMQRRGTSKHGLRKELMKTHPPFHPPWLVRYLFPQYEKIKEKTKLFTFYFFFCISWPLTTQGNYPTIPSPHFASWCSMHSPDGLQIYVHLLQHFYFARFTSLVHMCNMFTWVQMTGRGRVKRIFMLKEKKSHGSGRCQLVRRICWLRWSVPSLNPWEHSCHRLIVVFHVRVAINNILVENATCHQTYIMSLALCLSLMCSPECFQCESWGYC